MKKILAWYCLFGVVAILVTIVAASSTGGLQFMAEFIPFLLLSLLIAFPTLFVLIIVERFKEKKIANESGQFVDGNLPTKKSNRILFRIISILFYGTLVVNVIVVVNALVLGVIGQAGSYGAAYIPLMVTLPFLLLTSLPWLIMKLTNKR